jgi:DNA-binding NarL/FixJ family response regulator
MSSVYGLKKEKQMSQKIKVMIADDHAMFREGIRYILESDPQIQVVGESSNGRQAVKEAERIKPQVIIMDIAMPELNGIEATRQILQKNPSIKIIILTMHYTTEHIYQALQAGAKGFVIKEAAGKELIRSVWSVYTNHRYLSRQVDEMIINDYLFQRQNIAPRSPLESLSPREREILQMVVEGKTSAAIAEILFISAKTVETYRSRLMVKLGVKDRAGLIKFALEHGITA